jgi:uncharacterized protein (TIGR02001 family)
MMKTMLAALVLVCAVALTAPAPAQDVAVSIGADLVTDYVWRGQVRNEDGALQPWVNVGVEGFTLTVWGSIDVDDQPNDAQWEFTELDVTGSYTIPVGSYALELGGIYYDYPNTDTESTIEVFGTFTFSGVILDPYVSLYYDIDEIEGFYARVGGSYGQKLETFDWAADLSLGVGSSGYNDGYYGVDDLAVNDLLAKFTVTVPFSENFSAHGYVFGSWLLNNDIKDAVADDSAIGVGAGVTYTF